MVFSSSDHGTGVGSVADHGDGTYTSTIAPSRSPGDVTITATDTSVTPSASASATLHQVCQPDSDIGGPHCAQLTINCPPAYVGEPSRRFTVQDTTLHPATPAGTVRITIGSASGPYDASCALVPRRGVTAQSDCTKLILGARPSTAVRATYDPSSNHTPDRQITSHLLVRSGPNFNTNLRNFLATSAKAAKRSGEASLVLGLPIATGAITATGGAGTIPGTGFGGSLAAYGAAEVALSDGLERLSNQIKHHPDRNYRTVAVPRVANHPLIAAGHSVLTDAVRSLILNDLNFEALAAVLPTTLNRSVSAGKARAVADRSRQIRAAQKYLEKMAKIVKANVSLQNKLARLMRQAKIHTLTLSRPQARTAERTLGNLFPAPVIDTLRLLGATTPQIAGLITALTDRKVPLTTNLAALPAPPKLIHIERTLTTDLLAVVNDPTPGAFPKLPAVFP